MSNSVSNTTISGITDSTGRSNSGSGAGRGGGRNQAGRGRGGRGYSGTRNQQSNQSKLARKSNFKGDTEAMNGHVFECFEEHSNRLQFGDTCDALEAYTKKTMSNPKDLSALFSEEISSPSVQEFDDLPPNPSETAKAIWNAELREYVKRKGMFKSNIAALHAVILGQCSLAMKDKLKTLAEYKTEIKKNDCVWLLHNIRSITRQFYAKKNGYVSMMSAQRSFFNCQQGPDQEPAAYLANLRAWADTIAIPNWY